MVHGLGGFVPPFFILIFPRTNWHRVILSTTPTPFNHRIITASMPTTIKNRGNWRGATPKRRASPKSRRAKEKDKHLTLSRGYGILWEWEFAHYLRFITRQNDTMSDCPNRGEWIMRKQKPLTNEHLRLQIVTLLTNPTAPNIALAKLLMRVEKGEVRLMVKPRG